MGLFDRFVGKARGDARRAKDAHKRELEGDLAEAVDLYQEAGLPDEAARVMLLRADAEASPERRIALCSLAAHTAVGEELKRKASGRKALISFDVLRARGGTFLKNEVLSVARDLEEAGELLSAAEAFALAGDPEGEVRALTAAGAIERLEERLRAAEVAARSLRDVESVLKRVVDLDRTAERRAALEMAVAALARQRDDRIADIARAIRARLARGPIVDLEIDGARSRYALGDEVTIGRGDATIVIASRAVSRRHLRIFRAGGEAHAEDLGTRNGTTLAGARLQGIVRVGSGVDLRLGGEVACAIEPHDAGVAIEIAGDRFLAPLGDLAAGPWRVAHEAVRDESFVVLKTPEGGARPFLAEFQLASKVELCEGDEIRSERGGDVRVRLPSARRSALADEETGLFTRTTR